VPQIPWEKRGTNEWKAREALSDRVYGGAYGTKCRNAIDLEVWRLRVLNYLNGFSYEQGEALMRDLEKDSYKDHLIDPKLGWGIGCGTQQESEREREFVLTFLWEQVPSLISEHLEDSDCKFRSDLLQRIEGRPHGSIRSLLIRLASDPVDSVRCDACNCLGSFNDDETRAVLADLLHNKVALIRSSALFILAKVDPPSALDEAAAMAKDDLTREGALIVISCSKDERCLPRLLALLKSKDELLALSACCGIGSIHNAEALGVLKEITRSGIGSHKCVAIQSLTSYNLELVLPTLNLCLEDQDPEVVAEACLSLKELGGQQALSKIKRHLENQNPVVRSAALDAVKALTAIDGPPPP